QKLIRQNSEKIGTLAEAAVLPINQRSIQRTSTSGEITLKNVESQGSDTPYAPTATTPNTLDRQRRYFPIFMIGISLVQVVLMYTTDDDKLLMIFGFDPHRRHEIWRIVTIMLVHSRLSHLWSNVIFQLILGVLLEIVHVIINIAAWGLYLPTEWNDDYETTYHLHLFYQIGISESPEQKLIRQNSEKIGTLAEAAVLPINQRSIQRTSTSGEITLKNVESQGSDAPYAPTATAPNTLDRQQRYFPIFMIGISLIQVLLMYKTDDDKLLMIFGFDPHRRHEIWRLVTIMLAHSGLSHLWSNVIFQLILGVLLEIVHGWKRIAIIYVSSIVGGSLFISVLSPGTYAVGASAGDYGLLFSHLATIIINWNEMDRKCCRLFWLIFYIAFDVGLNLYSELILQTKSNVSHAGHLGGAITGFLVSILQKLIRQNSEKIGTLAEAAVLPINQRSIQRTSTSGEITLKNVESQGSDARHAPTATAPNTLDIQQRYFPIFMIGISLVQVTHFKSQLNVQFSPSIVNCLGSSHVQDRRRQIANDLRFRSTSPSRNMASRYNHAGSFWVSHAGHLGGAITGFLVSILVLKNFEKHPWEEKMQRICIGIVATLSIVIVIINIAAWGLYLPTEWNVDYETTYYLHVIKQIIESPEEQYKFNGTVPDH
ncbi:Rhomboid-related protein 1, partial [Pseudolycoriella hygida]